MGPRAMLFPVLACFLLPSAAAIAQVHCPHLYNKIFNGYVPRGNASDNIYSEVPGVKTQKDCVVTCCKTYRCNVAFMARDNCYHVKCDTNEMCLPSLNDNAQVSMVLVRPVSSDSWDSSFDEQDHFDADTYRYPGQYEDGYKDYQQFAESNQNYITSCTVGIGLCEENEECVQNNLKSRSGTCKCKTGYVRGDNSYCVQATVLASLTASENNGSHAVSKIKLDVTAESKEIKLPEDEVSLRAVVSPPASENEKYSYTWTLLPKQDGSGAVKQQNAEVLHLSKLSEGLYTFKVNVSSETAYGETFVNVTVLPASRINKPPQIVITPANQTIKLPNTGAVLDASSSTDDDGIVLYHWELQTSPVGYQPQLVDGPTLQLKDLSKPGNYTFKLTVTDTDKATSVATANITVLKLTDYPPEANAGQDTIIYLPHNQITLNGNLSTDDHMITTWEWTKGPDDTGKAVDMQDTHTPYLRLSDLEEGVYTFQLRVTDSANQSSVASVHVFVKPPTNKPPVARAGDNITISLPQTWVEVDASKSTDDNKIVAFEWEKLDGPSAVVFQNVNASKTNVTGLTKGSYTFQVTVTDDNNNQATALQYVLVNQNKNQKPTANAGEDLQINLPRHAVYVNGSKSSDDWAIVKWKWTRTDSSLAYGKIAERSDETSVLILTDLVPGKYVFNLTVFDEQGLSDWDAVTLEIKNDPKLYYLVEMTINTDIKQLTHLQYTTLVGKLALLVEDLTKLKVRELKGQFGTDRPIISFYVEDGNGKPLDANRVVRHLREKLKVDASLLGFSVYGLQTAVCQNNCSGHGVCDEMTRRCICEAFWMPDMFNVYLGSDADSDCSWSILYVVLGAVCGIVALAAGVWGALYLCMNRCSCRSSGKPTTYKLIEDTEDIPPSKYYPVKTDLSDTDSDSDVVFESRNKAAARFNSESRNGHKASRNGFVKLGRRVKT